MGFNFACREVFATRADSITSSYVGGKSVNCGVGKAHD